MRATRELLVCALPADLIWRKAVLLQSHEGGRIGSKRHYAAAVIRNGK